MDEEKSEMPQNNALAMTCDLAMTVNVRASFDMVKLRAEIRQVLAETEERIRMLVRAADKAAE